MLLSGRIYKGISKNRKILKLFKFVGEIYKIHKTYVNKEISTPLKSLMILSRVGSFFYYILDNFIWLINTNISSSP